MPLSEAAGRGLPRATLTPTGVTWARHGKVLEPGHFEQLPNSSETTAWFSSDGSLIALGEGVPEEETFRVVRGFRDGSQTP